MQQRRNGAEAGIVTSMLMLGSSRSVASTVASSALLLRSARSTLTDRPVSLVRRAERDFSRASFAGHQNQVVPTLCKAVGVDGADADDAPVTTATPLLDECDIAILLCLSGRLFTSTSFDVR